MGSGCKSWRIDIYLYGNQKVVTQALHGLAPKCEMLNMQEIVDKSTSNYVTLLSFENGTNLNTKG